MTKASTGNKKGDGGKRGLLARPLDSLLFLLPLLIFYELVIVFGRSLGLSDVYRRVVAVELLQGFFELFGTSAAVLPGLAVVVILLVTHIASRQPWELRPGVIMLMYVEAIVWALPLIALNQFTTISAVLTSTGAWISNLALCTGAGIYEELVFRLVLISALMIVGNDLLRISSNTTLAAAILLSAGAFALHHHPPFGAEQFNAYRFSFRSLAGIYLGMVFVFRGYGPAAGAHIAYNFLVIMQFD